MKREETQEKTAAFRLTDDAGELLRDETGGELVFSPGDYAKGETGALYAAARKAAALQREGETVRLYGPAGFTPRRYDPDYLAGTPRWTYRIPCSEAGCPNWIHPVKRRAAGTCWEHFARSPETAARAERMNAARRRTNA